MNSSWNPDPLGYVGELRDSLCRLRGQLDGSSGADIGGSMPVNPLDQQAAELGSAAYLVVMNLGSCRLYGIDVPADLATQIGQALPPDIVVTAAQVLASVLTTAAEDAKSLPARFDDAEAIEDQSVCTDFLHQLMEFWAVFVVIDDEYQSRLCKGTPVGELSAAMDRVLEGFQALDDLLQQDERLLLLSVATELPLLENWRGMLAAPFNESPPWWLDGTLEAVAQATSREILSEDAYLFRSGVAAQSSVPCERNFPVFGGVARTSQPATLSSPRAVLLLLRRSEEIAAHATELRIAASARRTPGAVAQELERTVYPVEGENAVKVRLAVEPGTDGRRHFRVFLVAPTPDLERYGAAVITFQNGSTQPVPLGIGAGGVELSGDEVHAIAGLALVEASGGHRHVDLNACCHE
ncbi:MAG TPA: hypothetical protein VMV69_15975 [Pirellulales bacterium]|nr:hypothetical protein [Pirellulales bacterium]